MWRAPGPLLRLELLLVEWCNTNQWPRPVTPMEASGSIGNDGSERTIAARGFISLTSMRPLRPHPFTVA